MKWKFEMARFVYLFDFFDEKDKKKLWVPLHANATIS